MKLFKKNKIDWLVIVFIHEMDEKYNKVLQKVIKEFEDTGVSENNVVLLVTDLPAFDTKTNIFSFTTRLEKLSKNETGDGFKFKPVPHTEIGEFNYTNGRNWEELLKIIDEKYHSEHTCMITMSHGAGVGIAQKDPGPNKANIISVSSSGKRFINKKYNNYLNAFSLNGNKEHLYNYDDSKKYIIIRTDDKDEYCKSLNMLWSTELADALESGFKRRKVDLFFMANCFMQTFETGWLLKNKVDNLVAPEGNFIIHGYSYAGFLKSINERKSLSVILKNIKKDLLDKWYSDNEIRDHIPKVTFSINSLKRYWLLKWLFEIIAWRLNARADKALLDEIIEIRQKKTMATTILPDSGEGAIRYEFIDLITFLEHIEKSKETGWLTKFTARKFKKIFTNSRADIHIGQSYLDWDGKNDEKMGIQGLSIYLPYSVTTHKGDDIVNCAYFQRKGGVLDTRKEVDQSFVSNSRWDDFIKKYILYLQEKIQPAIG
jgi:hypothetical protein